MKKIFKDFLAVAVLLAGANAGAVTTSTSTTSNSAITGIPFFSQRSQGTDLARRMVGEVFYLTRCDTDCFSGAISAVAKYTQTFNKKGLAQALTFNGAQSMTFGANGDVLPVNFLLGNDFEGTINFNPKVQNFIFDINFRLNLDEWLCGLYFEIGLPINWTRWSLGFTEVVTNQSTAISPNGVSTSSATSPYTSIIEAWKGQAVVGEVAEPMNFAVVNGRRSKTTAADLKFMLGYNFWCSDCGHFGIDLRVVAPTGTRPAGQYFFEPISGNGKHTELGGGISAHYVLWENDCDQSFSVWFEGEVYHMFKAKQTRTFDLIGNGNGSRYLLLKQFDGNGTATEVLSRGPNVLTQPVNVTIGVAGEAVILFDYQRCGLTVDVGYDVWGRTKEKIKLRGAGIAADTWAVKGGTNPNANNTGSTGTTIAANGAAADTTNVYISNDSLNLAGAANPSAYTNRVFGHISYAWEDCDYAPFVGIGGSGEFSGKKNHAFSQWAVWAKGGFAFS